MQNLKKTLLKTPLAKTLKEIEASLDNLKVKKQNSLKLTNNKTVYCISPYKTGTTFLASCYNSTVSMHEPMQYLTFKKIESNFDNFFIKRLNALNLKLECSGFLSAQIDNLSKNKLTKELTYICILRKPTSWINSVINYWQTLDYLNNDYINDYFWKEKVGVDLLNFKTKKKEEQELIVNKLITFYFNYLKETQKLKNILYFDLNELESNLSIIDKLIDEQSYVNKGRKRQNNIKFFDYQNPEIDEEYFEFVKILKHK